MLALGLASPSCEDTERVRSVASTCPFSAGQLIEETYPTLPRGADIRIDHIVVILQENRSFDHYFQTLSNAAQRGIDVAPPGASNTGKTGIVAPFTRAETPCLSDVPHTWNAVHEQINGGKMDGFARMGGQTAMHYYDSAWLPYYHALANTFAIADHYHASVPGPTWPNRMYALAGTSFGHITNTAPPARDEEVSIFHQLEAAGQPWAIYGDGLTFEEEIFPKLKSEKGDRFRTIAEYVQAANAGALPAFAWVTSAGNHNEHPPNSVQAGEAFVAEMIEATMKSPNWSSTAIFFTYDEHGGFYDHVPPPSACPPDDMAPARTNKDVAGGFDQLGVRVPMMVISPYSKPGYVSHTVFDHTSILRFVQARFGLPAMTRRDAHAVPPLDMFDFEHPAFLTPPKLPAAVEDPAFQGVCADTKTLPGQEENELQRASDQRRAPDPSR